MRYKYECLDINFESEEDAIEYLKFLYPHFDEHEMGMLCKNLIHELYIEDSYGDEDESE